MSAKRFRPAVERAEDRLVPAGTPTDVFVAAVRSEANADVLFVLSDLPASPSVGLNPAIRSAVNTFVAQSDADAAELTNFRNNLGVQLSADAALFTRSGVDPTWVFEEAGRYLTRAQLNGNLARSLATRLSIPINPPVTPPPPASPPGTPIDDSGLTGVLPADLTTGFRDIGNGVRVQDVIVGDGLTAVDGGTVGVYYTGFLTNGTVFDSVRNPSPPADFSLAPGALIDGFRAGVIGMNVGGVRRIFIPAAQAYGATGSPPSIPPNSDLIFEVKLVAAS